MRLTYFAFALLLSVSEVDFKFELLNNLGPTLRTFLLQTVKHLLRHLGVSVSSAMLSIFVGNRTGACDRAAALSAAIDIVRCLVVLAATATLHDEWLTHGNNHAHQQRSIKSP